MCVRVLSGCVRGCALGRTRYNQPWLVVVVVGWFWCWMVLALFLYVGVCAEFPIQSGRVGVMDVCCEGYGLFVIGGVVFPSNPVGLVWGVWMLVGSLVCVSPCVLSGCVKGRWLFLFFGVGAGGYLTQPGGGGVGLGLQGSLPVFLLCVVRGYVPIQSGRVGVVRVWCAGVHIALCW